MKKWLSLNRNKIYRKFKSTLNFNLIKKSKLTKFFKLFLERHYIISRRKVVKKIKRRKPFFFTLRWRRRYSRKKKGRRKFKSRRGKLLKRYRKGKFRKRKIKKKRRLNKFRKKENRSKYDYNFWRKSFFNIFKNKYLKTSLNFFSLRKKIFLQKRRYKYKHRRYEIYKKVTLAYFNVLGKRVMKEDYISIEATEDWLKKNRSFSIYMPEAKKRRWRKRRKSNWWKLRLINKKVALYYGFINLKKFRYIFNVYEAGMNFKFKSACRLELMLNMVILSLSIVDSIMLSNNFVRIIGAKINGNSVNYPYRSLLKGDVLSFDSKKFNRIFKMIRNRFKKDKSYVLNKFKLKHNKKQQAAFLRFKLKQKYKYESNRRNTRWYVRAIKRFPARIAKAKEILKRLEDINEKITQSDIDFFYGFKRRIKRYFKRWITDGRAILKKIKIIKSIPRYIEANFKILHFILWDYPTNKQIMKLFKKKFNLHTWNFSTQIENY